MKYIDIKFIIHNKINTIGASNLKLNLLLMN